MTLIRACAALAVAVLLSACAAAPVAESVSRNGMKDHWSVQAPDASVISTRSAVALF